MSDPDDDVISLDVARRKRRAKDLASWLPERVVAHWRCREFSCITRVGVTQTAIDTLAMFNAILAKRRERPISEDEVMWCDAHKPSGRSPPR